MDIQKYRKKMEELIKVFPSDAKKSYFTEKEGSLNKYTTTDWSFCKSRILNVLLLIFPFPLRHEWKPPTTSAEPFAPPAALGVGHWGTLPAVVELRGTLRSVQGGRWRSIQEQSGEKELDGYVN